MYICVYVTRFCGTEYIYQNRFTDLKCVLLSTTLLTLIDKCINRVPNEYKNRGGADDLEYMTLYVCCRLAECREE